MKSTITKESIFNYSVVVRTAFHHIYVVDSGCFLFESKPLLVLLFGIDGMWKIRDMFCTSRVWIS